MELGSGVLSPTAEDRAKIEAEIAAKASRTRVTCNIRAELGIGKQARQRPEIPFEEMAVKSRLAKMVKFERVAG